MFNECTKKFPQCQEGGGPLQRGPAVASYLSVPYIRLVLLMSNAFGQGNSVQAEAAPQL
jgi:hypothetical protein